MLTSMRWMLIGTALAGLLAMAIPGGVVVEGQLTTPPKAGTSTPFSVTVTKGGLEYFGRILITLPGDCRLVPRQLHGAGFSEDEDRNVAVISWLKLPEADQFEMLFDLEMAPSANAGSRTIEWDFSFIRNNDRVSVRPAPFHFEVAGANRTVDTSAQSRPGNLQQPEAAADKPEVVQAQAIRSIASLEQGGFICTVRLQGVPKGGFVKLTEQWPSSCSAEVLAAGGGVPQVSQGQLDLIWFDYPKDESVIYRLDYCPLSKSGEIIGTLSYVQGDSPVEIPVITFVEPDSDRDAELPFTATDIAFEVQVAASKKQVVTDYFREKLNFGLPLVEEQENGWFKYTSGSFPRYEEARSHREEVSSRHGFIGPFVVSRRKNVRISVQEALTRTGQEWIP